MSTLDHLFDRPEQICHVQCGFCATILLVSVPFSSLSMVVTVRCGHCTRLLSVNMMTASFIPLHLLSSLTYNNDEEIISNHYDHRRIEEAGKEEDDTFTRNLETRSPSMVTSSDNEDEIKQRTHQIVNKPPEKRQRAPSAYNCFIKEEIRRLKAQNPKMAHKEAFSAAAKNWAHSNSQMAQNRDADFGVQEDETSAWNSSGSTEVHEEGDGFRERKTPRETPLAKSPYSSN